MKVSLKYKFENAKPSIKVRLLLKSFKVTYYFLTEVNKNFLMILHK